MTGRPTLKLEEIQKTLNRLQLRIAARFPESGLSKVCGDLYELSKETDEIAAWIAKPILPLRIAVFAFLAMVLGLLVVSLQRLNLQLGSLTFQDLVQVTESGLNEIILLGAGILFLVTIETRIKRSKVVKAINQLRAFAHIIDMHQLTKDPDIVSLANEPTPYSPRHNLNSYELGRYLDYCSEMLALVSKIGFIYVNNFDDPVANNAVKELEDLTNGLSRKIWQKIMIIRGWQGEAEASMAARQADALALKLLDGEPSQ